ncbi:hypothetical protein TGCAST_314030 [Toxoplasma gondii CAST]|uniref:Uncharacterized protein n=1 Tax=Toxoplasma gondii CAST TaxID=943122 RepID=A0A3R7YTN9_TOXGO|nr:hypothetical protein TGCAST_314030 [Toxoplasma gondii CAST]
MFHRRPGGGPLDGAGGDRALEGGEQRAQCVRFCSTMLLILSTLFIIRVQQERYDHSNKHAYRVVYKYPWEHGSFLKDEHSQLQLVYLHPAFSVLPAFVESLDDVSLLTQPLGMRAPPDGPLRVHGTDENRGLFPGDASSLLSGNSEETPPQETVASQWLGRHDLGSNWLLSFRPSNPHPADPASTGSANRPSPNVSPPLSPVSPLSGLEGSGSIVGVVMDSRLFRRMRLPGCSSTSAAMFADHCYIALVRFPLDFCFTSASLLEGPGTPLSPSGAASPFLDISWTCSAPPAVASGAAVGMVEEDKPSGSSRDQHCMHVVSGLSVASIQRYVDRVFASVREGSRAGVSDSLGSSSSPFALDPAEAPGDNAKPREGPEAGKGRRRALRDVGTVAYFCGNPLQQLLALDTAGSRLFFAQPVPRRRRVNPQRESPETAPGPPRRLGATEAHADEEGDSRMAGEESAHTEPTRAQDSADRQPDLRKEDSGDEKAPREASRARPGEAISLPDGGLAQRPPHQTGKRDSERRTAAEEERRSSRDGDRNGGLRTRARVSSPRASSLGAFAALADLPDRTASLCISSVSLEDGYREVTECREVRNEAAMHLRDAPPAPAWRGVWLHFDARNSSLVLFSFDQGSPQDLILTSMHADSMQLKFSLRIRDFHSGWLLASEDSSTGKILLIGDRPPYAGSLQSIDVETGFREHTDLHRTATVFTPRTG